MRQHTIRFLFATLLLLGCAGLAAAQDKIYLNDGTIIDAKVKEINLRSIVYRAWDNQDGADHILARREVSRIVYQNGVEERMTSSRRDKFPHNPLRSEENEENRETLEPRESRKPREDGYGKNILSFAPVQMTFESVAGFGLHYERIVDKGGYLSVYIPLAFSIYNDNPGYGATPENRLITSFYPGIKFYPGGSNRMVSYSVGPSLGFGFGSKYQQLRSVDPGTGSIIISYNEKSFFKTGFLVNNGINIQPSRSLYVGLEFGVGILYYNNETTNYTAGDDPILQFNLKIGYRF